VAGGGAAPGLGLARLIPRPAQIGVRFIPMSISFCLGALISQHLMRHHQSPCVWPCSIYQRTSTRTYTKGLSGLPLRRSIAADTERFFNQVLMVSLNARFTYPIRMPLWTRQMAFWSIGLAESTSKEMGSPKGVSWLRCGLVRYGRWRNCSG